LGKVAAGDKETSIRLIAIGKMTDQSVLIKLAESESPQEVRKAATDRLESLRSGKPN